MKTQIERQFKVGEVANLLSLKENTIRKWILLRKISYRKIHGAVRIPESELARLLGAGHVPARQG